MEAVLNKLKEAARIRADIAKQESVFWEKIADALEIYAGSRATFNEVRRQPQPVEPIIRKTGYLSNADAAEYLSVSQGTLNKWRVTGGGPKFVKIGRTVRYKVDDLDNYVSANTFPHTSAYRA